MNRIHIIGGGFAGLAVGYYLTQLGRPVDIFEKSERLGGLIGTKREQWGLVETAANGILNNARVASLLKDLGVNPAKRPEESRNRYIFRGQPKRWPLTPLETVRFVGGLPVLLAGGARGVRDGETFEVWATRLFGEKAFQYLFAPALQGIYGTADLDAGLIVGNLSRIIEDKLSKFDFQIDLKKIKRSMSGGVIAPAGGMEELIAGLAAKIQERGGEIHLNANGDLRRSHPTVIATSAPAAALLLLPEAPELARELTHIEYLPITSATIAVSPGAGKWPGFGCLFPRGEGFWSLGVLFNNFIFADRSSLTSETWMFPFADRSDDEILNMIKVDRKKLTGDDEDILYSKISKWPHALPHYNQKLAEVLKNAEPPPQVYLIGNYLGAVGLSKILEQAAQLAEKIHSENP